MPPKKTCFTSSSICLCNLFVQPETARVIWAFHDTDDPMSEELTFSLIHSEKGFASLNLLGGLPDVQPDPEDLQHFDLTVDDVSKIVIEVHFVHDH